MERALAAGKVRAIGVSNFFPDRFVDLAENVEVPPAVNQMETHVFNQQADNRTWYAKYGTALESWGPLAQGKNNLFAHPVLSGIGEEYSKTAAQVALRYLLQRDVIIIPKSCTASAWPPTWTSSTSSSTTPIWRPSRPWMRARACSSSTRTLGPWSSS